MSVLEQVSDASVKAERPPTYYLLSLREKYVWGRSFTSATGYILSFHGLHRLATNGHDAHGGETLYLVSSMHNP